MFYMIYQIDVANTNNNTKYLINRMMIMFMYNQLENYVTTCKTLFFSSDYWCPECPTQ